MLKLRIKTEIEELSRSKNKTFRTVYKHKESYIASFNKNKKEAEVSLIKKLCRDVQWIVCCPENVLEESFGEVGGDVALGSGDGSKGLPNKSIYISLVITIKLIIYNKLDVCTLCISEFYMNLESYFFVLSGKRVSLLFLFVL